MKKIFLICGYGIPREITEDFQYNVYLNLAFNKIYDYQAKNPSHQVIVIFSGGKTDSHPPYERDEASQMIKLFKTLVARPFVAHVEKKWELVAEPKALSTMENLLYTKGIMERREISKYSLTVFCDLIKENVIKRLGKEIFNPNSWEVQVLDFNFSPARYLDPGTRKDISKSGLQFALWALKSEKNLKKFRNIYKEKLEFITAFKKTPDFQSGDELNADVSSSLRGNPAFKSGEDVIKREKDVSNEEMIKWWEKKFKELGFRFKE